MRSATPGIISESREKRASAFSMMELMIAVVILGVGLLITSSMFPIAWYKARDVAESTVAPSCADAADFAVRSLMQVNAPLGTKIALPVGLLATDEISAFFPGDWFPDTVAAGPISPSHGRDARAALFPDTRVHPLNMGNYRADDFAVREPDPFSPDSGREMPVADNAWTLDDNFNLRFEALYVANFQAMNMHEARIAPHDRLFPAMSRRPDAGDPALLALWDEQFTTTRRYCWSVLYRMSEMPGPDGGDLSVHYACTEGSGDPEWDGNCRRADEVTVSRVSKTRVLTMYYVTLHRPPDARYARQEGFQFSGGDGTWDPGRRTDKPRARTGSGADVLLPCPWRIEADLVNPPARGSDPSGVPSEIQVNDVVPATMLEEGTHLIDDRTGRVFRVTQRRELSDTQVVFTLDGEYAADEIYVADYEPFPLTGLVVDPNWRRAWTWRTRHCDEETPPGIFDCSTIEEDEPQRRFFWVFPPSVERVQANGVPIFDGTPPVVSIEMRQMLLAPKLSS